MQYIRILTALSLAPLMARSGFRFSKHYRWESTRWHSLAHALVETVLANHLADDIQPFLPVRRRSAKEGA